MYTLLQAIGFLLAIITGVSIGTVNVLIRNKHIRKKFFLILATICNDSLKLCPSLVELAANMVLKKRTTSSTSQNPMEATVNQLDIMNIPFTHRNKHCELKIKYDAEKFSDGATYYAITNDGEVNLNHNPGLPLFVTAADLGVNRIKTVYPQNIDI